MNVKRVDKAASRCGTLSLEAVLELANQGLSTKTIAEYAGTSAGRVCIVRRQLGCSAKHGGPRKTSSGKYKPRLHRE
jgi:hypothetical protein